MCDFYNGEEKAPGLTGMQARWQPAACLPFSINFAGFDNGILEGTNSLIQAAKDGARNFGPTKKFIITNGCS